MTRIERIGGIHAVVFESYRGHVPLLERKVGPLVNSEGTDLWVLCMDERIAMKIEAFGHLGINEYVTGHRRHTYAEVLPLLPDDAAVTFSRMEKDGDDTVMRIAYPEVSAAGQRFVWRGGTYRLVATTAKDGRHLKVESRIARTATTAEKFAEAVRRASRRLAARAPKPFDDADDVVSVSEAGATVISGLTHPAAAMFRHWLARNADDGNVTSISFSARAFDADVAEGVDLVTFERASPRILTTIRYLDGSTLVDLGLTVPRPLPETVLRSSVGTTIDRLVDGVGIGSWPVRSANTTGKGVFFDLRIPSVPIGTVPGLPPMEEDRARRMLEHVLGQDLRKMPRTGPSIIERDRACGYDGGQACMIGGGPGEIAVLTGVGYETAAFLISQLVDLPDGTMIDMSPWIASGTLRRRMENVILTDGQARALASSSLMPERTT